MLSSDVVHENSLISYFIAIGIPLIFLLLGVLAKKLARGSKWKRTDFYLGIESTLAAFSAELIYGFDLYKMSFMPGVSTSALMAKSAVTLVFVIITILLLLVVVSTHQDWLKRNTVRKSQILMLGIGTNIIGTGVLLAFILFVKVVA